MAERYTSQIALVLDAPVEDVGAVVQAAGQVGDIDRASPVRHEGTEAQEVHWGGRMQRAVVRRVVDETDGSPLLRTEAYVGGESVAQGLGRQIQLLQGLARQLQGRVRGIRDLSAQVDHDEAWLNRAAVGRLDPSDAITVKADGEGTWWVHTHGAARFDVPDLELYGLSSAQLVGAEAVLRHVHTRLLAAGLKAALDLPTGEPVYLVPVLEAWPQLPLDWPGVGRAGQDRGHGLDGPRATLSILHRPRFGRYRKDLEGVVAAIPTA